MYLNEFDATLKHIQGKWKILILYTLYENDNIRFGELKRYIHDVSQKTLTAQLKALENDDLIIRKVYDEKVLRVEYSLTKKGLSLIPLLDMICEWGLNHIDKTQLKRNLCK